MPNSTLASIGQNRQIFRYFLDDGRTTWYFDFEIYWPLGSGKLGKSGFIKESGLLLVNNISIQKWKYIFHIIKTQLFQVQPLMMSFKSYLGTQDDSISDEDAVKKYAEYKLEFKRQQLNEFFVSHKDEEW